MAGGEGTRLRPLTSNQPKPMVSIAGKPCIEHIVHLLRRHGMDDIVVTVAYLPQVIRGYLGDGEELGVNLRYSVEETPLGTAGSVKNAGELLDDTFLVISGDALCDFDLTALVDRHRESGAVATVGLKAVDNPLEFGVVITDEDGRIERFLEKPSWGQVFSDTINTGVYVLEPEVLRSIPEGEPFDFSKQLFPSSSARKTDVRPRVRGLLAGHRQPRPVSPGELRRARRPRAARDLGHPPALQRLLGDGVQLADLEPARGACSSWATTARSTPARGSGRTPCCGANVVVKEGASVVRSVLDSGSYVGRSARLEGTILGKRVDIRAHAVLNDGVAVGDECSIGAEAVLSPGVKVYPFKTIEAGAAIHTNLIWESRGITTVFGRDGVAGLVNVDVPPRWPPGSAWPSARRSRKGARVVASRDTHPASRMVKRAIIAGLVRRGVRLRPALALPSVNRHEMKVGERAGGLHVRVAADEPDVVQVSSSSRRGSWSPDAVLKRDRALFSRQEFRRVARPRSAPSTSRRVPPRATCRSFSHARPEAIARPRLPVSYSTTAFAGVLVMPAWSATWRPRWSR